MPTAPRTDGVAVKPCKVADLIMLVAGLCKHVHEASIHLQTHVLVRFFHLSLLQHAAERGAFLVHQSIGRQMLGMKVEGMPDVRFPVV